VIYRMVTLSPQTTPVSTFCVAFNIYVVDEHIDVKFGVLVDRSKSQPIDDKLSQKGAWSRSRDLFKFSEIIDNISETA